MFCICGQLHVLSTFIITVDGIWPFYQTYRPNRLSSFFFFIPESYSFAANRRSSLHVSVLRFVGFTYSVPHFALPFLWKRNDWRRRDLNRQPLEWQSSVLTTKPRHSPKLYDLRVIKIKHHWISFFSHYASPHKLLGILITTKNRWMTNIYLFRLVFVI